MIKTRFSRIRAFLLGCVCAVTTAVSALPTYATTQISAPSPESAPIQGEHVDLPSAPPTLWVVGDSTAAEFADVNYYSPRYGWGTQLGQYFSGIYIRNLAISGTSSKSYLDTPQYQTLLREMKGGDYLLIAFGHNDERAELGRYTNPNGTPSLVGSFQYYLYENYIQQARDRGATPVLCTPIVRRDLGNNYTGESGHITSTITNEEGTFAGGDYAKAIRQLGVGKSVTVLDLTARTKNVYEQLGAQGVKERHAWTSQRESSIDNTHTNFYGAACNAWFIADELKNSSCPLKGYLAENIQLPVFDASSLNPNYQPPVFTAPTSLSSLWSPAGEWKGTVFGDIGGPEYLNHLYYLMQPEQDGIRMAVGSPSVRAASVGKIARENEGIAMYYQAVPANASFILSADVTINSLDFNNQASFGLMVRDDIYLDHLTNDTLGDYVTAAPLMLGSSEPWNCFARKNGTLISGGIASRIYQPGETVHLEIHKSSDGYTCILGDNAPVSAGFDFPLTALDSSSVYVGMFIARNADVTFRNVNLVIQ